MVMLQLKLFINQSCKYGYYTDVVLMAILNAEKLLFFILKLFLMYNKTYTYFKKVVKSEQRMHDQKGLWLCVQHVRVFFRTT